MKSEPKPPQGRSVLTSLLICSTTTIVNILYVFVSLLCCVCVWGCVKVQEHCQYELVAPLAIMFSSTLLQVIEEMTDLQY